MCQALVLSILHKFTHFTVTIVLRPRNYFHSHFTDLETKAQVFWASACVHTLIIMRLGVGLNSGACVDPVDINHVPWGWAFVHQAFTKPHLARMCGWPGTHSSVKGLAHCSLCSCAVRAGRGGSGEALPRLSFTECPEGSVTSLNPRWDLHRGSVSVPFHRGRPRGPERLGNLPEGTHAGEGLSQVGFQLQASISEAKAAAMPHFLDWFVPVYLVISVLILVGFGACIYYFEPGLQEAHKWRMQRPLVDRDLRKTLMVRDNLAFGGPEV
nr:PREDICTED: uncharacterized protein LOC103562694 [Equus przewalskii]